MNVRMKVFYVIVCIVCLIIFPQAAFSGIAVQAIGKATLGNGDPELAEEEALHNSLKMAIEKSIGNMKGFNDNKHYNMAKEKILSTPESYISSFKKIRQWQEDGTVNLKVNALVDVQQLEIDFRSILKSVSAQLNHPVIAFVLTAFETSPSTIQKRHIEGQVLIDAFQEQFTNKGFDIIAADEAREFAMHHTGRLVQVISGDRKEIAHYAEDVGANFVSRGELQVTYKGIDAATGTNKYTGTISCEIIESTTKEVVASYSNTVLKQFPDKFQALSALMQTAAKNAAQRLAQQTLDSWIATTKTGKIYSITVENVQSHRKQSRIIEELLLKYAKSRNSRYDRSRKKFTMEIIFKGTSKEIEDILFENPELQSFENFDLIKSSGNSLIFSF